MPASHTAPACSSSHSQAFDFVVVATGLFNKPERPEWAQGLVQAQQPASGPWVVDAKDFTDASVAQVCGQPQRPAGREECWLAGEGGDDEGRQLPRAAATPTAHAHRAAADLLLLPTPASTHAPSPSMPSPMQGKRVVVVGAGKTAHDVGVVVSKVAASTTLVARRGHWMAPQTVLGEPQQLQCRCSMLQITQQRS